MEKLVQFDKSIFHFINGNLSKPFLDSTMLFISGSYPWVIVLSALLLWGLYRKGRSFLNIMFAIALLISLTDIVSFRILKPGVERLRPCYALSDVRLVAESCGGEFGFPSNHAANAMALAFFVFFCLRNRSLAAIFLTFALAVGYSRVYVGVHYPGDVLGGFLLGMLMATALYFFLGRYFRYYHLS